jgi:hypothetical protein
VILLSSGTVPSTSAPRPPRNLGDEVPLVPGEAEPAGTSATTNATRKASGRIVPLFTLLL